MTGTRREDDAMERTEDQLEAFQPLSSWLAGEPSWTSAERLGLFRRVVLEVRSLHQQGQIHGSIDLDHVMVGPSLEPALAPADASRRFGREDCDSERCPPELAGVEPLELPAGVDEATAALAARNIPCGARRVDVYQLGVLLCRLVSGEPIMAYLYDAEVKRRVPRPLQPVLERALGHEAASRLAECDSLVRLLDEAVQEVDHSERGDSMRETPAAGSVLLPGGDTESIWAAATPAAAPPAADPAALSGTRLGHFRILERIGRGGMGDVYKAFDESLERFVAVKVLPPELARDEEFVRRFRAEAIAAAQIGHPNIVPVHFIGQDAGLHFFAMQFVDGESLAQRLHHSGRLSADEAVQIIRQCLGALQAAHSRGLIHRDVKPGNILLEAETGRALVVDFGLVRAIGSTRMTATGTVMGTVDYLAPEQARGESVDGRADIYALGIVLYQLLAGRLPYTAENPTAMIFCHAYESPFPLEEAAPDLPDSLRAVVARMMAKNPAERYQSCNEIGDELRAVGEGRPISAAPASPSTTLLRAPAPDQEMEPPERFVELVASRGLGRLRDWAATMFRRHAPEFIKDLQSTSMWVDSAVAEYERRCRRLSKLAGEAREIAAVLATQTVENQQAAAEAAQEAETDDEHQRRGALVRQRQCEEDVAALARQQGEQQREVDEIELQLHKAEATLARLRSQRDVLRARFGVATLRQGFETGRAARKWRELPLTVVVLGALVVSLLIAFPLAVYLERAATVTPKPTPRPISLPTSPYESSGPQTPSTASAPRPATEAELDRRTITNSIGMDLVLVPAGEFLMGTDKRDIDLLMDGYSSEGILDEEHGPNETPAHKVRISTPFYMGKFEVTQSEYLKVMGVNPSQWMSGFAKPDGENPPAPSETVAPEYRYFPVDSVTCQDAEHFCEQLSALDAEKQAGRTYRLPTEAEWEYACRAGTQTAFYFGNLSMLGWCNVANRKPGGGTMAVGSFQANSFGLYDMHGNVCEWCADGYDRDYYATSPVIDPECRGGGQRVLRGGSCVDPMVACRSAFRGHFNSWAPCPFPSGFRVVCEVASPAPD